MKNKNDFVLVNWSTFSRVFGMNPALIFNKKNILQDLQNILNKTDYQNKDSENNEDDGDGLDSDMKATFDFAKIDEEGTGYISSRLHEIGLEVKEEEEKNYIEIIASNYYNFKNRAQDFLITELNVEQENIQVISQTLDMENKISSTIKLINELVVKDTNSLIINPVIGIDEIYKEQKFKFTANPFAIHIEGGKVNLYILSYTSRAKNETNYLAFYMYKIFERLNIKLSDISNIIIDPRDNLFKRSKKGEINFFITKSAYASEGAMALEKLAMDYAINIHRFMNKTGMGLLLYSDKYVVENTNYNLPRVIKHYENEHTFLETARESRILSSKYRTDGSVFAMDNLEYLNSFYDQNIDLFNEKKYDGDDRWKNMFTEYEHGNLLGKNLAILPLKHVKLKNPEIAKFEAFRWYQEIIMQAFITFGESVNIDAILYFASKVGDIEKNKNAFSVLDYWLKNTENFNYKINIDSFVIDKVFISNRKEITNALREICFKDRGYDYVQLSGTVARMDSYNNIDDLKNRIESLTKVSDIFNVESLNKIKQLHIKDARISWYDYEGFADIISPFNGVGSYQQVVSQVSVIVTQNGHDISKENIVVDPKSLNLKDFVQIIDAIYADKADFFVVYNKTYENSRNKEIRKIVIDSLNDIGESSEEFKNWLVNHYKTINVEDAKNEIINRIDHINKHTVDLLEVFKPRKVKDNSEVEIDNLFKFEIVDNKLKFEKLESLESLPDSIANFHIGYLKYFYSIKKIEHFITENKFQLKNLITPYAELKIQKGTMAMFEASNRYLGATNDGVWFNNIVPELKRYCENDVRAMIMVYDLIMLAARGIFDNIDDFEYKLENSDNFVNNNKYKIVNNKLIFE
ncbi:UU173 family protein [Mycoplasmopsis edwardii]|nr:DUF2779 domain-containing protein [Mycoplasmopsis edwardii]